MSERLNVAKERLSPDQIQEILRAHEEGQSASDLAKQYGVSLGSVYMWRAKYQKTSLPPDIDRVQKLDEENQRLKMPGGRFAA